MIKEVHLFRESAAVEALPELRHASKPCSFVFRLQYRSRPN